MADLGRVRDTPFFLVHVPQQVKGIDQKVTTATGRIEKGEIGHRPWLAWVPLSVMDKVLPLLGEARIRVHLPPQSPERVLDQKANHVVCRYLSAEESAQPVQALVRSMSIATEDKLALPQAVLEFLDKDGLETLIEVPPLFRTMPSISGLLVESAS
jgi:hypothetical protein